MKNPVRKKMLGGKNLGEIERWKTEGKTATYFFLVLLNFSYFRAHMQQCQMCGSSLTDQASDSTNADQVDDDIVN